jgi:hypothetical protein
MQPRTKRILGVAVVAILLLAIVSVVAMAIVRRAGSSPRPAAPSAAVAAAAYRRILAGDGSVAEFERAFGDVDALQAEWYAYTRAVAASLRPVAVGT